MIIRGAAIFKNIALVFYMCAPNILQATDEIGLSKPEACEIVLFLQQRTSKLSLGNLGIQTRGVSANSFWFGAPKGVKLDSFISTTEDEVREILTRQLKNNSINGDVWFLIDIEYPVYPKDFFAYRDIYGDIAFEKLITAYKLRVDIARELLPDARIGLYGMPTPTGSVKDQADLQGQISGIQAAADLGLLDSVDDIYPVLYLRYGTQDRNYITRIVEMTKSGIGAALTVRKRDGGAPGVVPLFSYKVFNGRSDHHNQVAPVSLGRLQLEIAREMGGVSAIAYWAAQDSHELEDWLKRLKPAPVICQKNNER